MAIKNKNGTLYKLKKPNTLSKNQEFWGNDQCDYVLHNCSWSDDIIANQNDLVPEKFNITEEIVKNDTKETRTEISLNQPVAIKEESPPVILEKAPTLIIPQKEVSPTNPSKIPDKIRKDSVIFWCLPVVVDVQEDSLYGDVITTNKYGDKFTFEAIVIEKDDLEIKFWSNADLVSKGSIVYPSKYTYRKEEYKDYRWWEIKEITEKGNGKLIYAILSTITPDFSD